MDDSIYSKFNKSDLENECAVRHLETNGSKKVLIQRLITNDDDRKMPARKRTQLKSRSPELSNNKDNGDAIMHQHPQHYHLTRLDKDEMSKYVLWRRPVQTVYYFICELITMLLHYLKESLNYKKTLFTLITFALTVTVGFQIEGQHLPVLLYIRKQLLWYAYWVGLGIASSIGFGTGLHTFLLYLGPFIAKVTLAAYECNSVGFPEPPYPDEIMCPNNTVSGVAAAVGVSLWTIMSKVRLESFMWGLGTAIGELPPYFMARASALSSKDKTKRRSEAAIEELNSDEEELEELEELLRENDPKKLTASQRLRLFVFKIINKVGFFGILLCASIPNPLFDLAGITCGHFLVKFSTFFGATLIGKAVIKMHIQKLFVIVIFSEHHIEKLIELLGRVPFIGKKLQPILIEFFTNEKKKLHAASGGAGATATASQANMLSWLLEKLVLCFILFFVISIVNSLAQRHYKRKLLKSAKLN